MLLLSLLLFLSLWYHLYSLSYGYTQGTDSGAYKQLNSTIWQLIYLLQEGEVGLGYVTSLVPVGRFVLRQDADTQFGTQLQNHDDIK